MKLAYYEIMSCMSTTSLSFGLSRKEFIVYANGIRSIAEITISRIDEGRIDHSLSIRVAEWIICQSISVIVVMTILHTLSLNMIF